MHFNHPMGWVLQLPPCSCTLQLYPAAHRESVDILGWQHTHTHLDTQTYRQTHTDTHSTTHTLTHCVCVGDSSRLMKVPCLDVWQDSLVRRETSHHLHIVSQIICMSGQFWQKFNCQKKKKEKEESEHWSDMNHRSFNVLNVVTVTEEQKHYGLITQTHAFEYACVCMLIMTCKYEPRPNSTRLHADRQPFVRLQSNTVTQKQKVSIIMLQPWSGGEEAVEGWGGGLTNAPVLLGGSHQGGRAVWEM